MDKVKTAWRKSSYSGANGGNCVQVADGSSVVLVRDSKDPDGPRLSFGLAMWEAFTASVRAGARSVLCRPGPAPRDLESGPDDWQSRVDARDVAGVAGDYGVPPFPGAQCHVNVDDILVKGRAGGWRSRRVNAF
jgi:uncharacterized protein DUF397